MTTRLQPYQIALAAALAFVPDYGTGVALAAADDAPAWVQLFPAGPEIAGRDARRWKLPDPAIVVAAFTAHKADLPIDYEHAQDRLAVSGKEAPAAGWINGMEIRNGEVWGRVAWTRRGKAAVLSGEYRYLSPAFMHTPDGSVTAIVGAGLVNRPNFVMAALANKEVPQMEKLLAALGLNAGQSEADAIAAVEALKLRLSTASQQVPDLALFVPRGTYDAALARITAIETATATARAAAHEADVTSTIDGAIAAGKITPGVKDIYLAICQNAAGLAQFKALVAATPTAFKGQVDPARTADGKVALSAEQKLVCTTLGITEEKFRTGQA